MATMATIHQQNHGVAASEDTELEWDWGRFLRWWSRNFFKLRDSACGYFQNDLNDTFRHEAFADAAQLQTLQRFNEFCTFRLEPQKI
jgi:hypothetical protein